MWSLRFDWLEYDRRKQTLRVRNIIALATPVYTGDIGVSEGEMAIGDDVRAALTTLEAAIERQLKEDLGIEGTPREEREPERHLLDDDDNDIPLE